MWKVIRDAKFVSQAEPHDTVPKIVICEEYCYFPGILMILWKENEAGQSLLAGRRQGYK